MSHIGLTSALTTPSRPTALVQLGQHRAVHVEGGADGRVTVSPQGHPAGDKNSDQVVKSRLTYWDTSEPNAHS